MSRTFTDPPCITEGVVDFDDPLERTAIAELAFTFNTPADVERMLTGEHDRQELAYTWLRTEPSLRRLYRHRAAVIIDVAYHGLDHPIGTVEPQPAVAARL